jgi:hypothetical protein
MDIEESEQWELDLTQYMDQYKGKSIPVTSRGGP